MGSCLHHGHSFQDFHSKPQFSQLPGVRQYTDILFSGCNYSGSNLCLLLYCHTNQESPFFQDCLTVGKFIATKVVLNEFNAFADLASYNPEKADHLGDLDQRLYLILRQC